MIKLKNLSFKFGFFGRILKTMQVSLMLCMKNPFLNLHNSFSQWPLDRVIDSLQCTISWKMSVTENLICLEFICHASCSTTFISSYLSSKIVTTNWNHINQQVTNVFRTPCFIWSFTTLVDTPEAVCAPAKSKNNKLSANQKHQRWCEWLAGLIDGDGCFQVSKKGYTSLEISIDSRDDAVLRQIQNMYAGSLKPRAGLYAVRYRLHNLEGMLKLCKDVNAIIRHPVRLVQF